MGQIDLPGNSSPVQKQSKAHFELGANLVDQKVRIATIFFKHQQSLVVYYDLSLCVLLKLFNSRKKKV